ncbi:MAG: putative Adenylyl cyclase CyaB [Parcubacteria group bacterium Gr01-1014_18]|nr:MAG: putative Adenylyl cyclase CyaB [Parcubacteria group bacterium Greene0416_36]TSC80123.1 MAG: putative Adenylyl cyclase CyaB [Parcubacteria group bacterium Gr01-1014_18]TSC99337.1 MAG: putative Adenylyl cyclase CyaB [Parcubacteria group bacterium Greene1014_20]TSD06826.1 MAG: putative Adenylyl cyclase CyaB [Parcubacteria group bacterium Greene0714_2]
MREIEIKLRVKNLHDLEKRLAEKGCVISSPIAQHDVIYSKGGDVNAWKESKEGDVVLRIRHLASTAEFNLKQQKSSEMDNLEYETEVKDPAVLHNILLVLGYTPEVEVKKMRRKGKLGKYEVCLDEVEQLGTFIELETLTDEDVDPAKVREDLFVELESLGLSRFDEETRGYDTQIYQLFQS